MGNGGTSVRLGEVEKLMFCGKMLGLNRLLQLNNQFKPNNLPRNLDFSTSPNLTEDPPFPLEVKAKG